jgi:hypothetical protein
MSGALCFDVGISPDLRLSLLVEIGSFPLCWTWAPKAKLQFLLPL